MIWKLLLINMLDSQHNLSSYKQFCPTIILHGELMQLYNCWRKNHLPMVWTSWIVWNMMSQLWNFFVRSRDSNFLKHEWSLSQAWQAVFENGHIRYWISSTCHTIWRWISLSYTLWIRWRVICFIKVNRSAIQACWKPINLFFNTFTVIVKKKERMTTKMIYSRQIS